MKSRELGQKANCLSLERKPQHTINHKKEDQGCISSFTLYENRSKFRYTPYYYFSRVLTASLRNRQHKLLTAILSDLFNHR